MHLVSVVGECADCSRRAQARQIIYDEHGTLIYNAVSQHYVDMAGRCEEAQ